MNDLDIASKELDDRIRRILAERDTGELQYGQGIRADDLFVGAIIDYYGALSALPDNWHECDGTNGTPDMRGKLSIGADGSTYVYNNNYGAATAGPLSHTGTAVTVSAHAGGAVGDAGAHEHNAPGGTEFGAQSGGGSNVWDADSPSTEEPNHNHPFTQPSDHTVGVTQPSQHAAFSIIPPVKALYKVMRIS